LSPWSTRRFGAGLSEGCLQIRYITAARTGFGSCDAIASTTTITAEEVDWNFRIERPPLIEKGAAHDRSLIATRFPKHATERAHMLGRLET
jgi:hypothetical protein